MKDLDFYFLEGDEYCFNFYCFEWLNLTKKKSRWGGGEKNKDFTLFSTLSTNSVISRKSEKGEKERNLCVCVCLSHTHESIGISDRAVSEFENDNEIFFPFCFIDPY